MSSRDQGITLGEVTAGRTAIVQAVVQTVEGRFHFDVRGGTVGWTLASGSYEFIETQLVKHLFAPGDFVVDVGANLGWYSTIMARRVGADGIVLAFEPDETNLGLLRINLAENGMADRVRVFPVALFERDGEIEFERSVANFGDHRLRHAEGAATFDPAEVGERNTVRVPARTLDGVLRSAGLTGRPIKLLKVDTQGAEVAIFRGAHDALSATLTLVAEFWPYGLQRTGASVAEYVALVSAHFSQFARVHTNQIVMQPISAFAADTQLPPDIEPSRPDGFSNYLFVK